MLTVRYKTDNNRLRRTVTNLISVKMVFLTSACENLKGDVYLVNTNNVCLETR